MAAVTASSTYFSVALSSGPAKTTFGNNAHETTIVSALRLKFIIDNLHVYIIVKKQGIAIIDLFLMGCGCSNAIHPCKCM